MEKKSKKKIMRIEEVLVDKGYRLLAPGITRGGREREGELEKDKEKEKEKEKGAVVVVGRICG